MFEKLNFKAVAPIQRAPKERGSVYMAQQPLAGNRLLNAVGKHRKVVVKRPNGEAKVLENANAMPDGIFGRAKFKVDYRDATPDEVGECPGEECIRVGSVSGSQLASTNLRRINDEIKKETPYYKVLPQTASEGNCQDHVEKVVEKLKLPKGKLPRKDGAAIRKA